MTPKILTYEVVLCPPKAINLECGVTSSKILYCIFVLLEENIADRMQQMEQVNLTEVNSKVNINFSGGLSPKDVNLRSGLIFQNRLA